MGFWTDWLDPNDDGKGVKGKWGTKSARYRAPAPFSDMRCGACEKHESKCRCDKDLGRPRKWYE